ncbi:MAG: AmmeMemoRadiSam system protein A [Nitrospirae bacterium]|nr:AmmeMemoRadiSam system protein A [Nitrospirota bacterium]
MLSPKPHPLVELAQEAIYVYLSTRIMMQVPASLMEMFARPAGVFVCLKKNGQLRGCVGTYQPARPTVAEEVVHNAIASATRDPRFSTVTLAELKEIDCSVDVLTIPVLTAAWDLDPQRFGILVVQGPRRGLLLPDLDGIETVEQQIREAKQKAGIFTDEAVELYCFTVQRYR